MQQPKSNQQKLGEKIKSHVKNFVVSVILMKYIVLLYKNHVISKYAEKSYLKNLLNLLDEQTKPENINVKDTNPLASIQLSDNLIEFLIKNLNTHDFIQNLKFACTAGHSIDVTKLVNIMNSVKPLKPYVNSVLRTIKLPDKEIIDDIYKESVTTDGDLNQFFQGIVSFADEIAKEIVHPSETFRNHHPMTGQQTQQTHGKQTQQTHGKQTQQTHGKQTQQTHGKQKQKQKQQKQKQQKQQNMKNKNLIPKNIILEIRNVLERLKNRKKHHLRPQTTVSIPTN